MINYRNKNQTLLGGSLLQIPTKPRVFISYHHDNDQAWYDRFSTLFNEAYDILTDNSLEREIDSDDTDYVKRAIREKNITGTSITVVLCGEETWRRRWVDWEIQMTLNKQHALLGILLPTHSKNSRGEIIVPDRLLANINSGFAHWIHWKEDPASVNTAISSAREISKQARLIDNSAPAMIRSR